ncbi:helix-turn-helix domain-containing protein [Saccharibacillus qingshengii]|uniref:helix-turn-helix domain-containing protein n=1 Tax=Saccharibacillus qingshengii TaxID=1763540 RepID=UPI0015571528|nr:helix-turn-helix domain-containing protein [Saccharibacillus qingshengii]
MGKITLTVKEVANLTGLSTTTNYNMCAARQLPYTEARSRILLYRSMLEKWLAGESLDLMQV